MFPLQHPALVFLLPLGVEPSPTQGDPGGKSTAHAEANIPVSSASRSTKPADEAAAVGKLFAVLACVIECDR